MNENKAAPYVVILVFKLRKWRQTTPKIIFWSIILFKTLYFTCSLQEILPSESDVTSTAVAILVVSDLPAGLRFINALSLIQPSRII